MQLFQSIEAIESYLAALPDDEAPIDGVWLIQDYVRAPEPFITRCEFIGGRFHYAVRVDTSDGFELCPADACNLESPFCPAEAPETTKFTVIRDFDDPILENYALFLKQNGIEIADIEFIWDVESRIFTYDVNTNTNYNAQAEAAAKVPVTGMQAVARFLGEELAKQRTRPTAA